MKKIDMGAIITIAMVACLLFCTPALANYNFDGFPVETRASGTVNGGVFIDSVPWADATTLTGNFNVPTGNIIWARLYTGIWGGNPEFEGWVNVTFNGVDDTNELGPIHLQGQNDANPNVWCSGYGKHWMYYTVTDLVNAGAVNTATTTKINATVGNFDGRVYGIVLVVVYEDGDDPKNIDYPKNIQYWINDGSDGLNYKTPHNDGTTDFAGSVAGSVTDAELTMVHLTAYDPGCADCLQFNGNVLDTSMVDSNTFELNSWDVTGDVESSENDAWYNRGEDDSVSVCNAILTLVLLPDLVVEKWLEIGPDGKFIVSYTVTNIGDGPAGESTTCKYVDSVLQETQDCPALVPDESYSGAFEPEECPCGETLNVTVCADNDDVVDESDEGNNCEVNLVDCPPCKPDLEIVEKGEEWVNETHYSVSYVIHNNGTAVAPGCHNTTLYVDGAPIEHKHVPVDLAPCETYTDTFDTTIECMGDCDIIRVCADNYNVIDELDETNNCLENEWICKEGKPDLEIVEKGEEWVNETHYSVSYVIHNNGTAVAPGCHNTTLYVDGAPIEHKHVPVDLAPCETYTDTFDTTIECMGDCDIIRVCADNYNVIDELDETNNCLENEWICKEGKPDLEIVEKGEEWVNETHYSVSYVIHNNGTAVAPGCHNTTLYVDGAPIEHKHVPVDLAPCETYTDTFDTTIECMGDCDIIRVCADNYNVIDELDETNNCLENEWICKEKKPDLEIVEKGEEWVNETHYSVSYVIHNNGTAVAPGCHNTTLYVDGAPIEHKHVPVDLAPCETYTDTFDTTIECMGDCDIIRVCADNYNVIDELDETNNCLENEWICKEKKPDLEIVEKGEEWVNETHYSVSYVIHNNGTAVAPGCHNTTLYVDGAPIEHKHVPVDLAPCETYTDTFDTTIECMGDCDIIRVCADNYNVIDELDEMNNCLENEWICKEKKPDLEIVEKGEEWVNETHYSVSYVIHNNGTAVAPGCHNTTLYVDGAPIEHKHVPVDLAPCETYTDTFDTTIECMGDCDIIRVCADNYNVIDELDETNNCLENEWICKEGKPDLEIVEKGEEWVNETHYSVSYVIHNNGTAVAPGCHNTTLYVDGAPIEHKHVPVDLAPCETYTDTFDTTIECMGDCDIIRVCADNYNVIDELDEMNNCLENEWICKEKKPDLNVTAINVNADLPGLCGLPFGPVPHAGARTQCNSISAEIEEDNGVATGAFDVCFYVDDDLKCKVPVAGMAGGDKKTVWCNCSWYPLAGPHTINVTVDCENVIVESDETNNTLLKDVTAVQHGLKGNSWQDGRNITTLQCHEQDNINLTYSVGNSKKAGVGWTEYYSNWTTSDLPIPDGATIEKARLYAYYNWDKTPAGNVTDFFALSFNGVLTAPAAIYTDTKHPSRLCNGCTSGMCKYNYPYGMLAYDVTGEFNAIAGNTAVLTNSYPGGKTAMTGMLLVVVYKHPDEPGRIIWINEGFDTLFAGVYYGTDYGVSSDEATTYAPFEDCVPIPTDEVRKATLVTITNHAGDTPGSDKNRLYFNTVLLGDGLWSPYMGGTEIGANEANVLALLDPTDNTAAYQSNIPAGGTSGDWMEASNAILILEKEGVEKPDLNVTAINVNADLPGLCGLPFGPVPHAGARTQCNSISAEIEEDNGVATGAFDVCFYVDDDLKCKVPVAGMAGGDKKTVWCNCSWYPLAGPHTINVTVDCENVIVESDETNNTLLKDVTAVQHGLKGNSWQDGRNITTLQCHEQDNINLTYSVGDSKKVGVGWTEYYSNWTHSNLSIPDGATIEKARLYAYYSWDKTPAGNVTDFFALSFNGVLTAPAAIYTDTKHPSRLCNGCTSGMCKYNYPYGMLAYDVTGEFNAIAGNTAVLTNSYPGGKTAMTGMLLVVVYKHPDEPGRIIWINEGFDTLFAGVYYGTDYGVSSDEATTYAPFEDCVPIPTDEVRKATLVTITNHAGDTPGSDKNRLYFNTVLLGDGLWSPYMGGTEIGANEANVLALLDPTDNTAAYQSNIPAGGTSGDWMEASNAILILEKEGVEKPDLNVTAINVNADLPGLCGLPFGPVPHAGARTQCNSISAEIEEDNGVATGAFDVCFYVDDDLKCKVPVAGMAGGDKKTVWCNCSWYPLAGPHTINVTVDCENVIVESDETNNTLLKDVTAVQHGLKGNSWQDGRNITTLQCHEQDNINLTYSVGDSKKVGVGWTEYYSNWTHSNLSIPDGATIEKARLYAYYSWDKTPAGNVTDFFALSFNGVLTAPAAIYTDTKHPSRLCNGCTSGMCKYNYPYGMLAYDVTGEFNAIAGNTAVLTNSYPGGKTAMTGMLLVVVYKHPDEPGRIIWINEGFDTLFAGVYYGTDYGVSSDEATTYAPFEDCVPIPTDEVRKATLVTITNHAGDTPGSDKNRLYFNTVLLGDGLWSPYMGGTEIGANEANVLALLDPTDNTAAYQSNIPAGGTSGDWMEASNAILILEKEGVEKPDLNVTAINVNADLPGLCGLPFGPVPHAGARTQCNSISAEIEEDNGVATGAFDVCFYVDDDLKCKVPVAGMAGGDKKTVWCNCSWYPLAGPHTINVTVDCENVIVESDETNNTLLKDVTAVQHGLKGNSWQDGRNITTLQCHEQDNINLTYSVGDSKKVGVGWTEYYSNWTHSNLSIPDGATIEKARLYAYYSWDKTPAGNVTDFFALSFNGVLTAPAAIYTDTKHPSRLCNGCTSGMCKYNYPYGMLAYDVTGEFNAIAGNTAVLTNSYPGGKTAMTGMLLVVVYKHPDEPGRIIWINEGFDTLFAGVYYGTDYGVSSDEATTYAPFEDCVPIPTDEVRKATLVTITNHAGDTPGSDKNRLYFNTVLLGDGLWSPYMGGTEIGANEANVLALLDPTDNTAAYQSNIPAGGTSGDWMEASNAFLILEKKGEIPCPAKYAVYQANVRDPEEPLNKLRALRDEKLEDRYVTSYYDNSPALTLVLSRADSDLVKDGARLLSRYSIPVGLHVQGMDVDERITKQDVEEALSFTDRLKREVMKNRDAIGAKSTEAIIDFIDEFEGEVKASAGKTFSAALKSSIYYEGGQLRVDHEIEAK